MTHYRLAIILYHIMWHSSIGKLGFWGFVTECEKFNNVQIFTFWKGRLPVRWRGLQRKHSSVVNLGKLPINHSQCVYKSLGRVPLDKSRHSTLIKHEAALGVNLVR